MKCCRTFVLQNADMSFLRKPCDVGNLPVGGGGGDGGGLVDLARKQVNLLDMLNLLEKVDNSVDAFKEAAMAIAVATNEPADDSRLPVIREDPIE
jgi:hypothetical protein